MSSAIITANWFHLGRDLYFRKFDLYNMLWSNETELENYTLASASYGGPIAIKRNDSKFIKIQSVPSSIILIFSASGKQLASIKLKNKAIVCMGWSLDEKLICVQDDAMVVLHDLFGKYLHAFSIHRESKITDARIFTSAQNSTGVAVMTCTYKFFLINNIHEPKTRIFSEVSLGPNAILLNWAVIPEINNTDILVSVGNELCRLKQDEYRPSVMMQPDMTNSYALVERIAVSFNTRHLALYVNSGYLWLGSIDLRTKYCEVDTCNSNTPKQMVWCGNEAVALYWEEEKRLLIVGKNSENISFTYPSSINIVEEIDGVRIITNTCQEFLQKVPDVVQKIFRINSTDPGSFLLEASKQYQKNSHKANEYIMLVENKLSEAVKQCLDAVVYEFDIDLQKMLMRAAQFGKCFCPDINSNVYVERIRLLRVLNAVRDARIGIPLTCTQFHYLKEKALLERLITRKEYYLALLIADYLKIPKDEGSNYILLNWAKNKVLQPHLDEEAIARTIVEKLGNTQGISYSEIASVAAEFGKKKLAIKLLDYESKVSDQVKLLLQLDQTGPALIKAIESGDSEMVFMVILKLRENMPLADFKMTIRKFNVAQSLYIKYCQEHKPETLKEIFLQEDDFYAQAETHIKELLTSKSPNNVESLNYATEAYKKAKKDLNASICDSTLKLYRFQQELEEKYSSHVPFIGLSVHHTCKKLFDINEPKLADKVKNDFKMSEKRYLWLKIHFLAGQENFTELEKISKVQKLPLNIGSFIDICLQYNRKDEALKYLPRVSDEQKVKYFMKTGSYEEAAKIAFEQKDLQSLLYVQSKCTQDPRLYESVSQLVRQIE